MLARRVQGEQSLLHQRREELDREKRIAAGLLVHQPGQGPCALPLAMQSIGDQPGHIVERRADANTISCTRAPALRIASSVRISGCAGPTSLSR